MVDFKWELGTYFTNKEQCKDAKRTYVVHFRKNINYFKNDK